MRVVRADPNQPPAWGGGAPAVAAGGMMAPDPNQPPCFDFDLEKDIEATQRCAEAATALFHGAEDA